MTEQEWQAATVPGIMVNFLRDRGSERKLRLFACACCRLVWDLLTDWRSRGAVETAERFSDSRAGVEALRTARPQAEQAIWTLTNEAARNAARAAVDTTRFGGLPAGTAWYAALHASNVLTRDPDLQRAHVALLRCIFGNPFRPSPVLAPSVLEWENSGIWRIAQASYNEWRFEDLPILADALEDAGCDNADILSHCRGPGPHVRGCWVIDLILGKQ
jgi:hypothetical protein